MAAAPVPALANPAMPDDAVLMARIATGDRAAFTEFLARHLSDVVQFALRYLGQRADAEDVAQEAFSRVWRKAPGWRDRGTAPRAWLYRVTYHLCIDAIRRRRPVDSVEGLEIPAAVHHQPEMTFQRNADDRQLEQALAALPERQRSAIALCAYHGLSNQEAAAALEVSVEALESLLARGRRRLRQLLLNE